MIVLNYPNNPTGKILPKKIQDQILEIVKKHNLYVLSDEIYAQYSYGDWKSVLKYNYKKSIVTQSFSKSHAMTGFRIGYAIANPEIIEKMAKLQAICLTNVSEPIQYVALRALEADTTNNSNIVKSRLDIVIQKANEIKLDFIKPDGAMYLFARVKKDGFDGVEFANYFLENDFEVIGYDSENEIKTKSVIKANSLVAGVLKAEYVLLCTPTRRTPEIIRLIGPGIKKIHGQHIISIPIKDAKKELSVAKSLFPDANFVTIDAIEHDKKIAVNLGLTHLINLAFANILAKDDKISLTEKMSGTTFKAQKILTESIMTESPELIETIISNPEIRRVAEEFWKDIGRLLTSVQEGKSEEILTYIRSTQERLGKNSDLEGAYKKLTTMVNSIEKK